MTGRRRRVRRWFWRGVRASLVLGVLAIVGFFVAWHLWPFPVARLDRWPVSPVVTDREGGVLLRLAAEDDQWRFAVPLEQISPWLREATVAVEDERFFSHVGVDPVAVVRAVGQNITSWRTVSGASTLTMQVCRMMGEESARSPKGGQDARPPEHPPESPLAKGGQGGRDAGATQGGRDARPPGRTWRVKAVEAFRALQLERVRTKREILELYLNIAPYGGNLRGVGAAARAYFGKSAADLSLGEAALLAGLPQSPSRYRPDRHPAAAWARREHVLKRMVVRGMITPEQAVLAGAEPVIEAGVAHHVGSGLVSLSVAQSHALEGGQDARPPEHRRDAGATHPPGSPLGKGGRGGRDAGVTQGGRDARPPVRGGSSSVDASHAAWLAAGRRPGGGRTTIAPAIQANVGRLVSEHRGALPAGSQVAAVVIDIAASEIVALVGAADAQSPVDGQVNGVVARRSPGSALKPFIYAAAFEAGVLNADSTVYDLPIERAGWAPNNFDEGFAGPVPAGEALRRSLNVPAILVAEATGLARCVGVVEAAGVSLQADVQARGGLAVVVGSIEVTLLDLTNGYATLGRGGVRARPRLFMDERLEQAPALSAEVCAAVNDILSSRRRRPHGMETRGERDVPWFMWKTGTSSGRRDAWAVGHNGRYAIGVWVGRFSGAASPEFVGALAAEPLLAGLFDLPLLRRMDDPGPAPVLIVQRPLPPPVELAGPLRILSPTKGAAFVAIGEGAVIHPRANRIEGITWFLNGRLLEPGSTPDRLALGVGVYELRCVGPDGEAAGVGFTVRAPGAAMKAVSRR